MCKGVIKMKKLFFGTLLLASIIEIPIPTMVAVNYNSSKSNSGNITAPKPSNPKGQTPQHFRLQMEGPKQCK
jgi:hypothetical protein